MKSHVDPTILYHLYLAIKKHFKTKSYDVVKSNARMSYKPDLETCRYHKLITWFSIHCENKRETTSILVANFAYDNDFVFDDVDKALENHTRWQKYRQSITYSFKNDLKKIHDVCNEKSIDFNQAACYIDGKLPLLFELFLSKRIHIETLSIINKFEPIVETWSKNLDKMWSGDLLRITKVGSFINIDKNKFKQIYNSYE